MSSTTLGSTSLAQSEQDLTLLYEDDDDNVDNSQLKDSRIGSGGGGGGEAKKVKTRSNLNMEVTPDVKKSKNTAWIEEFLTRHHCQYFGTKNTENGTADQQQQEQVVMELNKNNSQKIEKNVVMVQDFEIDRVQPPSEELQAVLSDILSLKVRYKLVDNDTGIEEDKVAFFVVKIPPTNSEDRQLATLVSVHEREIKFYTQVVPSMKAFCDEKGVLYDLQDVGLVHCYHANFDRPLEEKVVEGLVENLSKAESTIVLEDLRPQGFGKRHFSQPLTLQEVKSGLRAIAKIHAHTWSISKVAGEPLKKLWPFYYKSEYAAMLYEALLEDGIPLLQKYLKEIFETNKDFDAASILGHLDRFGEKNLQGILIKLLTLAEEPSPTCLCHMDFWCDNIFFRQCEKADDPDRSKPGPTDDDLDCRILDWQMFSIGRPTHDVALLLFTALPAQIRKEECDNLLQFYLDVFESVAHKFNLTLPFDLPLLQEEYGHSQVWALLQIIASVDLALHDDATSERLLDALQDLVGAELI